MKNDACVSRTAPQRSNGGVREVTRAKSPTSSITRELNERYSSPRPAGTLNIRLTRLAMRAPSPRRSSPRSRPPWQANGAGAVARPPYSM